MKQKKEQGLLLRSGGSAHTEGWLRSAFLRLTATEGALLTFGGLGGYDHILLLSAMGAVLCLIWALLEKKKLGGWFPMGAMAGLLLLSLLARQPVMEGFRLFWNGMSDHILTHTGWQIPQWRTELSRDREMLSAGLFSLAMSFAVTCGAGTLGEKHPGGSGASLLLLNLTGAVLLWGGELPLGLAAGIVVAVILILPDPRRKQSPGSGLLCGMLAAILLLTGLAGGEWMEKLGETTREKAHELHYDTASTTLPEGDLTQKVRAGVSAAPALTVTVEQPQTLYLRGITGEAWEDGRWQSLPGDVLLENRELLSWLQEHLFSGSTQFAAAGADMGLTTSWVTVRNTGACGKWQYVPFHLLGEETGMVYNLSQAGVFAAGQREYSYRVLGTAEDIQSVLEQLQSTPDSDYRRGESAYREFVYDHYLQISSDVLEALEDQWQRIRGEFPGSGQSCAVRFLQECFPEEGESDIELPLEQVAGTSYQYATIAAMTLRYFGIPARYAEGYVLREEVAREAAGSAISLDSTAARSWVEVYQDGIGWIPMELMPGLSETAYEAEPETHQEQTPEEDEPEEEEQERPEEPQPDTLAGTVTNFLKRNLLWVLPLLVLLLLVLALVLRRKLLLDRRMKRFRSGDPGEGVSWIVADSIRILEKSGFPRENGSLRNLEPRLLERLGEDYILSYRQAVCLNDRALFSSRPLEEAQRQEALDFRDGTIQQIKAQENRFRRWWRMWILCVY